MLQRLAVSVLKRANARALRPVAAGSRRFFADKNDKKESFRTTVDEADKADTSRYLQNDDPFEEELRRRQERVVSEDNKGEGDPSRSVLYVIVFAGTALVSAYCLQLLNEFREESLRKKKKFGQQHVGKPTIGGEWQLRDTQGRPMGSGELKGSYYIIYFGFCNCPDICPASLSKLAKALDLIRAKSESSYFDLKLVFVSVDPDRDSPEQIRKFTQFFHKDIVGVSGQNNDDPLLHEMLRKFRIYATKIEFENTDEEGAVHKSYSFDHSVIAYLMSDSNEYLTHLGSTLGSRDLANAIVDNIMEDRSRKMDEKNLQQYQLSKELQEPIVKKRSV